MSKSVLLIMAIIAVVIAAGLYNDYEDKKRIREIEQNYLNRNVYGNDYSVTYPASVVEQSMPQEQAVQTEPCSECYGTGWLPNGDGVLAAQGYGSTKCYGENYNSYHVCDIIMCPTCHQAHCVTLNSHYRCKTCNGQGVVPVPSYRR